MAQLGSGQNSSYPQAIDTRQTFQNSPLAAPDSATRLDAEVINDLLAQAVAVQTALGANPQGVFGSVAARLQQYLPGGGVSPLYFAFAAQSTVVIAGNAHRLGTANLHVQVYDTSVPRVALQPEQVSISQLTYDVTITFATPQSGIIAVAAAAPLYTTTFTTTTPGESVTIFGTTHQLGTGALLVSVYTATGSVNFLSPASVTINQSTFNVVVTFATAQSGSIMVSAAGPRYVTPPFTNQTTVTVPGSTHGLASPALLWQVYSAAVPAAVVEPNTFTVDPANFTVTMTFLTPQSGFLVLVKAGEISGTDFQIRDGGIPDQTATSVSSFAGSLVLQIGSGNILHIKNKTGVVRATVTDAGNVGIGTQVPSYQLQLTGDAAKPGTNTWTVASDARLKEVLRAFTDGLATLMQIEPVWYRYTGEGGMPNDKAERRERVGVIAQAVQAVAPYMVGTFTDDHAPGGGSRELLTYEGHAMTFILINAIKELVARVAVLEAALLAKETPA